MRVFHSLKEISWKRQIFRLVGIYALFVAVLFFTQRSLLYHPFGEYTPHPTAQELWLPTADGQKALAWFLPPPEDSRGKVVVFFHGNGGNLGFGSGMASRLQQLGFGVMMPEYRGYPGYAGELSEQGIYADARASMDFLKAQGYAAQDIYLYGQSLGSGVAVQMAKEYDIGLLALLSPFTSIPDAAAGTYWFVPVQWLVRDRYDSLSKIADIGAPLQIFHGTEDRLVPYVLGERLFDAAKEPKRFYAMEGLGHNDVDITFVLQQIARFAEDGQP